jgi:hypothetical protein
LRKEEGIKGLGDGKGGKQGAL